MSGDAGDAGEAGNKRLRSSSSTPAVPIATAKNINDSFAWVSHVLRQSAALLGKSQELNSNNHWFADLSAAWFGISISTCFSGIGSPEFASECISHFFCAMMCIPQSHVRCIAAVEKDHLARAELQASTHPPEHIFETMESFLNPFAGTRKCVNRISEMTWPECVKWVHQASAITACAPCLVCGDDCVYGTADMNVSGPPCTDWSTQGLRDGAWGATWLATCVYFMQRRQCREKALVHENVPPFMVSILQDMLGDLYIVQTLILCPSVYGWPIARRRRITILLLRSELEACICPYDQCTEALRRHCTYSWMEFLIASSKELMTELEWSENLPTSVKHPAEFKSLGKDLRAIANESKWTRALSRESLEFLHGYRMLFSDKRVMACMLNQNPLEHAEHLVGFHTTMFTLISNNPCLWVDIPKDCTEDLGRLKGFVSRWWTPTEQLLAHGYVVVAHLSQHGEKASFCFQNESRTRASAIRQNGNTMHVHIIGLAMLYVVICVKFRKSVRAGELSAFLKMFV